jgi:hypothetical protein
VGLDEIECPHPRAVFSNDRGIAIILEHNCGILECAHFNQMDHHIDYPNRFEKLFKHPDNHAYNFIFDQLDSHYNCSAL